MPIDSRTAQSMVGGPGLFPREKNDYYASPRSAIRALAELEKFPGGVWEPACGDGEICKVLSAYGADVVGTDLIDRGFGKPDVDFLDTKALLRPNVVTNPPFKLAEQFVKHSLHLGANKAAFLLRLAFLEGARRRKMFESTPLARVRVFSKRIPRMHNPDYTGRKTTSLIAFAWFVWDRDWSGPPELSWLNPVDKESVFE